jgi:opacity protein-like surface antigen
VFERQAEPPRAHVVRRDPASRSRIGRRLVARIVDSANRANSAFVLGMVAAMRGAMSKAIASLGASVLVASLSAAAAAQTQPDPGMPKVDPGSPSGRFGGRGSLAIMGEGGVFFTHTSIKGVEGSTTTFVFQPAIDYFLIDHLSLGAFTGIEYSHTPASSTTSYRIGPRIGYDIPFSDRFSLWPKVGFSFNATTLKIDASEATGVRIPSSSTTNNAIALNVYVPVTFHSHNYFVGFGPALDTDLSGDSKATTISGRLTVGGWVLGR